MKFRLIALLTAALLCLSGLVSALAESPLPDVVTRFTNPFDGDPAVHRKSMLVWTTTLQQYSEPSLVADGEGEGYIWERYDTEDNCQLYIILTPDGERVLAYAAGMTMESSFSPNTFSEAVAMVEAGFDGSDEALQTMPYMREFNRIRQAFDDEGVDEALDQLFSRIMSGEINWGTAYFDYGHYLSVLSETRDGAPFYWFFFHNTPQDEDVAQTTTAEAPQSPEPVDEGWTCSNGHAGNTGNFCGECGAPRPESAKPDFCPDCGQDLREMDAKYCPNCGRAFQ